MRCEVVQRRLLGIEDPSQTSADVRAHLARCEACRDWQAQLVQLERHVPFLPVPRSRGKSDLLYRLVREGVAKSRERVEECASGSEAAQPRELVGATEHPRPAPTRFNSLTLSLSRSLTLLRSHAPTLARIAALILLVVIAWWLWPSGRNNPFAPNPHNPPAPEPLLASLVQRDLRLAGATTPRERIQILADLAGDLHQETQTLTQEAAEEELAALAKLYEQVVYDGILKQAMALPANERRPILNPIADRLAQTATAVDRLVQEGPAKCTQPLHDIATVARKGNRQLATLLREERS